MKKQKAYMPFSNCHFPFFQDHFGQFGYFFQVGLKQKNQLVQTKKIFLLINLVPRVPSFYIRTKFRLKNRVTTVHLVQLKQISSLIYAFDKEIYCKLKNIHLGKPPLIYKKVFLIRLHSSTFVQRLVYTRLDSSSGSFVFLEQIIFQRNSFKFSLIT